MPESLTDRYRCCNCDKTGKGKKLSKCERCHAVTYCSRDCQAEDWPRHKENCVPVMVKEYEGKGRGLVAAKDIKMGELILTDKAVVSKEDIVRRGYGVDLTFEAAKRLLLNQNILKNISLLNHSCAPNAEMGLLDGEKNKEPEKRFELRAVKNIAKEDEVTIYYPHGESGRSFLFLYSQAVNRALVRKDFGFDCRCGVCLGQVPNQDGIVGKIRDVMKHQIGIKDEEKTLQDWKREAIVYGIVCDLAKPIYIGRERDKMFFSVGLFEAAMKSSNSVLKRKALDEMRELADKTGLEMLKDAVDTFED